MTASGRSGGDEGSAAVLVLALLGAAAALVAAIALLAGAHAARADAQAAADLAALAAAQRHALARAGACETGREAAERNGARLASCVVAGDGSVTVSVEVDRSGVSGAAVATPVGATARAGPSWLRAARAGT
ncbi:secretion/DNA translocation related TadE-like protein [Flavimobilis soli]|uniref:Secretion/DNA translocation related TadE-like protein n=1 Tax=Flavimobilis soli TaxID=442709 RepID=A0A2A9EE89_9MICO|nr:secretion/DNA translocation related TadE-like protein [Flavimobilis soli]